MRFSHRDEISLIRETSRFDSKLLKMRLLYEIEENSRNWEIKKKIISKNMIYKYKNEKFCLWIEIYYKEIEIDWEEFHVINIVNIFLN